MDGEANSIGGELEHRPISGAANRGLYLIRGESLTIHHELVRKVTKKRGVLNQQTSTKMAASGFEFFLRLLLKWWLCRSKFFKTERTAVFWPALGQYAGRGAVEASAVEEHGEAR